MKALAVLPLLLILGFTSAPAKASFPDQQPVKQYFDEAEYVAYVRIESGEIHRINGDACGARYRIDVLKGFKGKLPSSATIGMGPSISPIEIGKDYLIFVSTRHGYDRRKMAEFTGMPEDFLTKCRTDETYLEPRILIGEGFNGAKESLLVPKRIVAFPDDLQSASEVEAIGDMTILMPVYVPLEKAFRYLEQLGSRQAPGS